jgi:hypothetical protein
MITARIGHCPKLKRMLRGQQVCVLSNNVYVRDPDSPELGRDAEQVISLTHVFPAFLLWNTLVA